MTKKNIALSREELKQAMADNRDFLETTANSTTHENRLFFDFLVLELTTSSIPPINHCFSKV
jgi:hypothetical protein